MNPVNRPTGKRRDHRAATSAAGPHRATTPRQSLLGTRTLDVHIPVALIDLEVLRGHFKQLADQANDLVQRSGYDLDDVIFERFLTGRQYRCAAAPSGLSFRAAVMWLADRRRLVDSIADAMTGDPVDDSSAADVVITRLGIDVWREVME